MRKIILPDVTFNVQTPDGPLPMTAGEQLHVIVATPSKPGEVFTIDQIRARLPLVEKLAALNGKAEFLVEDNEFTELLAAVQSSTWMGVSRTALTLVEAVENAETIEVVEAEGQSDE